MDDVLIIYASTHGHTGKIADRLGSMLGEQGLSSQVHEVGKNDSLDTAPFSSVIVMASIHAEKHQTKMLRWVKSNSEALNAKPTAFLSVSLSTASGAKEVLDMNRATAQQFADDCGWKPGQIELVAGCLQYPAYGFFTKFLMKRLARRRGMPLDTSQEHEYTDWNALRAFSDSFAGDGHS